MGESTISGLRHLYKRNKNGPDNMSNTLFAQESAIYLTINGYCVRRPEKKGTPIMRTFFRTVFIFSLLTTNDSISEHRQAGWTTTPTFLIFSQFIARDNERETKEEDYFRIQRRRRKKKESCKIQLKQTGHGWDQYNNSCPRANPFWSRRSVPKIHFAPESLRNSNPGSSPLINFLINNPSARNPIIIIIILFFFDDHIQRRHSSTSIYRHH